MHRTNAYPSVGHLPPTNTSQAPIVSTASMGYGGGYTLPPTAAYFPVGTYSTLQAPGGPQQTTIIEMQHDGTAMTQPNTPDLLMHRRQVFYLHVSTSPSPTSLDLDRPCSLFCNPRSINPTKASQL